MRQRGELTARQRRAGSTRRRAAAPAALAVLAIGLFGATPAWAEQSADTPAAPAAETAAPLGLSWRAVAADGELQAGLSFEVRAPQTATEAATGQDPVTALITDFAGQADYVGTDLDPVPGAFAITEFGDPEDPTRSHAITAAEQIEIRIAATAEGETPDAAWQTLTAPASADDAIPVIEAGPAAVPVAVEPETGRVPELAPTDDPAASAETPPPAAPQQPRAALRVDAVARAVPSATIVVRTGADRSGLSGVTGLAGVTLLLNTGKTNGTRPDGVSGTQPGWALCVSDSNGECVFEVPNTARNQANRDKRFWVVPSADSAPSGWYANASLRTGEDNGSVTSYRFQTGSRLREGATYRSGSDFMTATSSGTPGYVWNPLVLEDSTGSWQHSRVNPAPVQSCGIDVALVIDRSGSVGSAMPNLKAAADGFVNALVGTQSRMALFSFAGNSPESGAPNYPKLTSVSTASQASDFKRLYSGMKPEGGTNWDRGLGVAAEASASLNPYDITVVITDGNPTFSGPNAGGPGYTTRLLEIENGIYSANALKQTGSRIIAFGVGAGVTGTNSALNLRAISGPVKGSDYFQTNSYETAGQELRKLALGSCAGQLTVTKMVVPHTAPQGSIQGAAPADEGWTFTASNPGAGVTLPNPPVRVTEGDGTGTVAFPLTFGPTTRSGEVTVTETQQPGYTLQPVGGQNAVCTNLTTGAKVTPSGNPANGFRVAVPNGETVNCAVYNRAPDQSATVQVDKVWQITDPSGAALGTYRFPGDEGRLPAGLKGQLMLSGPGTAGATKQDWGKPRSNYVAGGQAKIDETVTIDAAKLPGCTLTSNQLTKRGTTAVAEALPYQATLTPGANTYEITNTVTCGSQLSLLKLVEDGTAEPANWDLTAAPDQGGQSFTVPGSATRSAKNTFGVTPDRGYQLSEAAHDPAAPLSYLLDRVERCEPKASAPDGCTWVRVDEAEPVTVGLGQNAVYRFVNRPAPALEVPLTGGLSSDSLGIAGASLAGLALLVGALTWSRRRRTETSAT